MSDSNPKFTIAGVGIDISWKLWILILICLVVILAMVAGIKVNVRNVDWFPQWNTTIERPEPLPQPRRPRIFRDEIEIEIQSLEVR